MTDILMTIATLDAAMFNLWLISKRYDSPWDWDTGAHTEIRFGPKDAKEALIALHYVIKSKRALKRSVKADKKLYEEARKMFLDAKPTLEDIIEVNKAINS